MTLNKKNINTKNINTKNINTIVNFILLLVLVYFIYQQSIQYNEKRIIDTFAEPSLTKTCNVNIKDIDPRFMDQYNRYNDQIAKCGDCEGAQIKLNIIPCVVNKNCSPNPLCSPNVNINRVTNLNGIVSNKTIVFPTKIDIPANVKRFFCIE
jgi:hypothetical protein